MTNSSLPQYQHEIGSRLARRDWAGAAMLAGECRLHWPGSADGWLLGSMAALFADQQEQALALVDERLSIDAADTPCLIQKVECLFALGRRADAIAADMATVFTSAPDGFFDVNAGHRLRKEIYEMGDSRDVEISIEKFLGRKQSLDPFLKKIGMSPQPAN